MGYRERRQEWLSRNPEYMSWGNMKNRCYNKRDPKWRLYGARGISVCDRWMKFENFLADMGRRPGPGYSLDRINNDGNYEPGNCRWTTRQQQARNRRTTRRVVVNGEPVSLAEAAEDSKVTYATFKARLDRGWTPERSILEPLRAHQ